MRAYSVANHDARRWTPCDLFLGGIAASAVLWIVIPAAAHASLASWGYAAVLLVFFALVLAFARRQRCRFDRVARDHHQLTQMLLANPVVAITLHELVRDEVGRPVDDVVRMASQAFEHHTARSIASVINRPLTEVFPGFRETRYFAEICAAAESGTPRHFEDFFAPFGRYYDIYVHPLTKTRLATVCVDITDRRRREEELLRQNVEHCQESENLRAILNAVPAAVVLLAEDGAVEHINRVAEHLVGKSGAEWLGAQPGDGLCCIHAATAPAGCGSGEACKSCPIRDAINTALQTGQAIHDRELQRELTIRGKRQAYWFCLNAVPVSLGSERRILLTLNDITQKKESEEELRRTADALHAAKEAADQASRSKSAFLANMSHEIRSPMTAILGYAEMLAGTLSDSRQTEAVSIIQRNGQYLLQLINDILDLSKVEAGKMTVVKQPVKTVELIADVLSLMRIRAESKRLGFRIGASGEYPETIQTDPVRLRQILINLLSNAIKFTEVGEVALSVGLTADDQGNPRLAFEVRDTGIGMTPEQMSRLFQPFSQGDESTSRRFGGTGLGLAVSRRLARLLGGDISVQSRIGQGSCFTLTIDPGPLQGIPRLKAIPDAAADSPTPDRPRRPSLPTLPVGCRILLAEDGPDNQRLFAFLLRRAGAEVTVAENGRVACDRVLGQPDNEAKPGTDGPRNFHLIFMDMQMPEMDGYTAVRVLREAGVATPIVALTAHAMPEDERRCREAGCDDYLSKPCDARTLLAKAVEWLGGPARQPADYMTAAPTA